MTRLVSILVLLVVTKFAPAQGNVDGLPDLADAPAGEQHTIQSLIKSDSWPRRAIAAVRLLNFGCDESRNLIDGLRTDREWPVRCFAVACLGERHVPAGPDWFATESEPRVLRTALRYRYTIDPERLGRGVRKLARQDNLSDRMLAVELGAASGVPELVELARTTAKQIIHRMNRAEAGVLSPRLAAVTDADDMRKDYRWQRWLLKTGRGFKVHPAYAVRADSTTVPKTPIQTMDSESFARLEDYVTTLAQRRIDLALCIDTTASMSGELAEVQGGIDDLMAFAGAVVADLRLGIVAYRDRGSRYETKGWEFTPDIALARRHLWSLSADGGGDGPESVHVALRDVFTKMTWIPTHRGVMVLIGDAPPHVGHGTTCINYARRAKEQASITTHVIQAAGKDVKHFPEIAAAGGGECVNLDARGSLMAQVTGLTLGEQYREQFEWFFGLYLQLCR